MAGLSVRTRLSALTVAAAAMVVPIAVLTPVAPAARADSVAYLVNVTVRPGYNFSSPQAALEYGTAVCGKVRAGIPYAEVMGDIKIDFHTHDDHRASYLIIQVVNELCPEFIWQLRTSAAGYRPPAP